LIFFGALKAVEFEVFDDGPLIPGGGGPDGAAIFLRTISTTSLFIPAGGALLGGGADMM